MSPKGCFVWFSLLCGQICQLNIARYTPKHTLWQIRANLLKTHYFIQALKNGLIQTSETALSVLFSQSPITHKCMKQNGLSKCGARHICKRATLKNLQKACAAYWLTFDPFCFHLHCSLGSNPTLKTCLSACIDPLTLCSSRGEAT